MTAGGAPKARPRRRRWTTVDGRGPKTGGLAIGLAVAADILVGGPLTGAAMNPARWFGPAGGGVELETEGPASRLAGPIGAVGGD